MPCGKEKVFHCDSGAGVRQLERAKQDELIQNVLNDELFGFFEVDIEVPEQLRDKFSEFSPLFILEEVPEEQIPQHMKDYKINTGRKKTKNNKKTSWSNESRKDSSLFSTSQVVLESRSAGHKNSQVYFLYIVKTFCVVPRRSFIRKKRC